MSGKQMSYPGGASDNRNGGRLRAHRCSIVRIVAIELYFVEDRPLSVRWIQRMGNIWSAHLRIFRVFLPGSFEEK